MSTTTLPTTPQEAYDRIVEWFSRPGAVFGYYSDSEDEDSGCRYRGDGSPGSLCRCAVGCVVPDDLYDPAWDNIGGDGGSHPLARIDLWEPESQIFAFMLECQSAHDDCAIQSLAIGDFLKRLHMTAAEYHLDVRS